MRNTLIWTQILYVREKVWIFFWLELQCSLMFPKCCSVCFLFCFFSTSLEARVWLAQSLFCSLKNRTMAPLQFLYSVSSLRHLPSSAVKNGTDVACFHFRKWHQTQICKVNDCTQEINPENEIWGLITLYLFREVYLTCWVLESALFSLLLCTPCPLCNGVFFIFSEVVRYSDIEGQRPCKLHRLCCKSHPLQLFSPALMCIFFFFP